MDFHKIVVELWEKYGPDILSLARRLVIVIIIIIAGKVAIRLSHRLTDRAVTGRLKADETLASVLRIVVHYAVIIICLIMILDTFGVSTTSFIAFLGAAGVAIGLALKDTLSNIASGIVILFLRPFNKGDSIECGVVAGRVRDIGLFATNLETDDGIFVSVPNRSLWGIPLKNYTRSSKRRISITITIPSLDAINTSFRVLREIIVSEKRFLNQPAPQLTVQFPGESNISIKFIAWVSNSEYGNVHNDQIKIVKEKMQEAGLSVSVS